MPWNDSTGPVPHRTEAEFLALVRRKAAAADAAQRRRHSVVAGAAALLMVIGLATVVVRRGPEPATQLMTTGVGPTSTAVDLASTSTVASSTTVPVTVAVPTTRPAAAPTTRTTRPPASTTTLACRDSIDPACGPFRWDPPPAPNRPLTVTVTYAPANPRPGEAVTFKVVVDDPDGQSLLDRTGMANDYGDGAPQAIPSAIVDCTEGYGPWTPPPPTPVHAEPSFQHTYAKPGTYVVKLPFKALGDCAYGPSEATATVTVTVAP